jgi:hypothetical protein
MRDLAEHNAMFSNPEGVSQVREARENTFVTNDDDFNDFVEQTFGKKVDLNQTQNQIKIPKSDPYLDVELDEIKFIPFKE